MVTLQFRMDRRCQQRWHARFCTDALSVPHDTASIDFNSTAVFKLIKNFCGISRAVYAPDKAFSVCEMVRNIGLHKLTSKARAAKQSLSAVRVHNATHYSISANCFTSETPLKRDVVWLTSAKLLLEFFSLMEAGVTGWITIGIVLRPLDMKWWRHTSPEDSDAYHAYEFLGEGELVILKEKAIHHHRQRLQWGFGNKISINPDTQYFESEHRFCTTSADP